MRSFHIGESLRGRAVVVPAVIVALVAGVVLGMALTTTRAEAQGARTFSGGTGIMMNYVKPGATADFEAVMNKLGAALTASENPERGQQAQGWTVYKAAEPGPNNSVIYVWFIDPVVPGADYAVSQILNEAFPTEVQALYESYSTSFAGGQALMNLELVADF